MQKKPDRPHLPQDRQRGSALILAVFVLVILTSMGVALLFVSGAEVQSSQANLRTNKSFFLAESGIEDARTTLYNLNTNEPFSDDLVTAAGPDGVIDFDINNVSATYDSGGNFTGFTGYNDDVPLKTHVCSVTTTTVCVSNTDCPSGETCQTDSNLFGEGSYTAFLTNDPIEGRTNTVDSNDRVMLTGISAGSDRSYEMVTAIIEKRSFLPSTPPATVTLLGPTPTFDSSTSAVKDYLGNDCGGAGVPGLYVPVIGAVGPSAEASIESGIESNPDYESGPYTDHDVFADLSDPTEPTVAGSGFGAIDSGWNDCQNLKDMIEEMREVADAVCTGPLHCEPTLPCGACDPTQTYANRITFVDGDYRVQGNLHGYGTLVVTGVMEFGGNTNWSGLILVFGEGEYYLNGGGTGTVSGGIMVADLAGPDGVYGTSDDCQNGFEQAIFDEDGGGNSGTVYCTTDLQAANPVKPYEITEFLQH
jgi:Tfp pilus assembly protein PilX